ncbi:sm-like protein LSM8 isoform X1 [Magnolia sinica]|uniref:sm-like protein LSM8 isoform X1 n=2 Tax=Magnolia sinica TaxID=86752 RepID=UPI00265823DF|nr:sm-like protein LSM8 isoform X1 [Magnolia sinica]XP_058104005.1 sm-like protein LSM8 isoform X1 [Magnolia sinica]
MAGILSWAGPESSTTLRKTPNLSGFHHVLRVNVLRPSVYNIPRFASGGLLIITSVGSGTMSSGLGLEALVDQTISIVTNDGRNIVGVLKGFDQATNIILDESHERVYSTKEGVQQLVLGLYIKRGDNISVVGELDEELDSNLNLSELRAHPLKPVIH